MTTTRNTRDLMRDWCAATGYPLPDLIGRGRVVREAGLLTQGALGINAPAATIRDGAVLLLSIAASRLSKDVAKGVEKYHSLPLISTTGHDAITRTDFDVSLEDFPDGMLLIDALIYLLEHCGSQREGRLSSLKVDRSEANPAAILAFGQYEITSAGENHTKTFFLTFMLQTGKRHEVYEESGRLNDIALNTMADLLAPNVAAASRARIQAEHENGPSGGADEPLPSDELPRAGKPATTTTQSKASDRETKSQAGFESYGGSSGGSSLPPTEFCDDLDDRVDRPSPCAA
jgi:hypothetical protein